MGRGEFDCASDPIGKGFWSRVAMAFDYRPFDSAEKSSGVLGVMKMALQVVEMALDVLQCGCRYAGVKPIEDEARDSFGGF